MQTGNVEDLVARIHASVSMEDEARPLAILAGSGLTAGAVPGVNEIINAIRKAMSSDDASQIDRRLAKLPEASLKYQEAFTFLSMRRPPELRDRIITACTLKAYAHSIESRADLAPDKLSEYERDVDNWDLPKGVESLGRIWSGLPPRIRGPILTTNFDPLCEVAIQKAGGHVVPRIMDADGEFLRDVQTVVMLPQVVHLHGYWRDSATLSMTTQLTLERPALEGSIQALLRQYTLIVLGYGAWRDALSRQLVRVIQEQRARELDVLWCYYGDAGQLTKELADNEVLASLLQAPGNIQFYTGIDVNEALPRLERKLDSYLDYADSNRGQPGKGMLIDWMPIADAVIKPDKSADDRNSAITFFDGRLPNWHDAVNPLLPKRDIARTLENQLKNLIHRRQSSFMLVTGASGEGKTTALMQAAAALATDMPSLVVLFNGQGRVTSIDEILRLPVSDDYLLVLDDAYRSIERLRELMIQINKAGRTGLHLLLGSRDTDWSNVGGFTFPWNRYGPAKVHRLRGINRLDAVAIIQSWERLGAEALGSLASLPDTESRVSALMDAAAEQRAPEDGAFLGALLTTRYGDGLVEHIRELLVRLSQRRIYSMQSDIEEGLLDAFFLVALPHAAGVPVMNVRVLAVALDIVEQEIIGTVILPLGDEAAISFDAERISVRHSLIARAACELAEEFDIDMDEIAARIVKAAVSTVSRYGVNPDLLKLAYLSQHLEDPAMAVNAARAAVEAAPTRLSYRTSLSRCLRVAGHPEDAVRIAEKSIALIWDADDAVTGIRPVLTEWGVAEGNLNRWARNLVLVGISLQDMDAWPRIAEQSGAALVCMALALRKLWESSREFVFLNAMAAVAEVGHSLRLKGSQRKWIDEAGDIAFKNGASSPRDMDAAYQAMTDACRAAWGRIEVPFPDSLPPRRFKFNGLRTIVYE